MTTHAGIDRDLDVIYASLMGDPRLDRNVRLIVTGLGDTEHKVRLARIDEQHSNVVAQGPPDAQWPDEALWAHLRAHDELHEEGLQDIAAQQHVAELNFALPMPGVARICLLPALPCRPTGKNEENQP